MLFGQQSSALRDEALTRPSFTQPVLVSLALALYRVFTIDFRLEPSVALGHSLGELSACCVGGLLSVKLALHIALLRGTAMQLLPHASGGMVAVKSSSDLTTLHDIVELSSAQASPASQASRGKSITPKGRTKTTSLAAGEAVNFGKVSSSTSISSQATTPLVDSSEYDSSVPPSAYNNSGSSADDESDGSSDAACDFEPTLKRLGQLPASLESLPESLEQVRRVRSSKDLKVLHDLGVEYPQLNFAAFNSNKAFVLSGDKESIHQTTGRLKASGFQVTILNVQHGFHSYDVDRALPTLHATIERLLDEAQVLSSLINGEKEGETKGAFWLNCAGSTPPKVVSTHTGALLEETPSVSHWVNHARDPVQFEVAVRAAKEECGGTLFLEIGMQAHLTPHVVAITSSMADASDAKGVAIPTMRKGADDSTQLVEAVGALFAAGVSVDIGAALPSGELKRLPLAPLVGKEFWLPTDEAILASTIEPHKMGSDLYAATARQPSAQQLLHQPMWVRRPTAAVLTASHAMSRICTLEAGVAQLPDGLRKELLAAGQLGRCPTGFGKVEFDQIESMMSTARLSGAPIELLVFRGDVQSLQVCSQPPHP